MKIKRKILIPISVVAFLAILTMIAIADIPPPPVNQLFDFGTYDTMMVNYSAGNVTDPPLPGTCRGCHITSGTSWNNTLYVTGGVPTRHHNLVATGAINPNTNKPFGCTDCHPSTPGTGNGILLVRNCIDCHNATPFWGNSIGAHVGNFTRPHHNTTQAQARNCKFCHGGALDDYNDGHYVPPYPESEITPSALYKVFNSTSGRVWGGCLACHAENPSTNPPIFFTHTNPTPVNGKFSSAPVADGKNNIHHNEILGITAVTDQQPEPNQCLWCHVDVSNVLGVRGCETCHSVQSIHNVQYDFANTSTLRGFGHIGSNNPSDVANHSWDCKGCHAWYDAGDINPFAGAIIPDVQSATPSVFRSNTPTVLTLTGTNFVQDGSTTVVNIDDTTTLTPDSVSNGQITVTVNLAAGAHYIKVVKTDSVENVPKPSDIKPLTVVDKVTINKVTLRSGVITISGSGFGVKPATNAQQYVTIKHAGNVYYSDSISSWSNSQIKVKKTSTPAAIKGDIITVITKNSGQASGKIN